MLASILAFVEHQAAWLGLLVLGLSAAIEYVFPPFPGDTITLLGAALAARGHFSVWGALAVLTAGSAAGAAADFGLGVLVRKGRARRREEGKKAGAVGAQLDKIVARFQKHGEAYIAVNRFLPGVRALFFYAAALAGMRFWRVMLFAVLSALAWNLLILGAGILLGLNFDRLLELFKTYSLVVYVTLGVVVAVLAGRWWWRRREAGRAA